MNGNNRQLRHCEVPRDRELYPLSIFLDGVAVPENVGSVFRLCDALGVSRLYLSGDTSLPPNRKLRKVARATEDSVPFEYCADASATLSGLQQAGVIVISLEITTESVALNAIDYARYPAVCLVLGAEKTGVSAPLLDLCDHTVHIPMHGTNSSMNLAAACAIATYEIIRAFANR